MVPGPRLRKPVHLVLQVVLAGLHARVAVRVLRHAVHAPHAAQPRLRARILHAAQGARALWFSCGVLPASCVTQYTRRTLRRPACAPASCTRRKARMP